MCVYVCTCVYVCIHVFMSVCVCMCACYSTRDMSGSHVSINYTLSSSCPSDYTLHMHTCIHIFTLSTPIQYLIYTLSALTLTLTLIVCIITVLYRNSIVIKSASFVSLCMMLLFISLLPISSVMYTLSPKHGDAVW